MKNTKLLTIKIVVFLLLFLTIPNMIYAQNKEEKIVYIIDYSDSNNKKFLVSKNKNHFIFRTFNKKKKEVQTCKWEVKLNDNQTRKLIVEIKKILENNKYTSDNYLFNIKQREDKMKLIFKNSSCLSEHKLYYLQKDCNRVFMMKMKRIEFEELIQSLEIKKEDI